MTKGINEVWEAEICLDSENTSVVLRILQSLTERGITVIMVTHDLTQLSLATHSVELSDGSIVNERFSD